MSSRKLQHQLERKVNTDNLSNILLQDKKKSGRKKQNGLKPPTDPSWEITDPTPNVDTLFEIFNKKYFWNKLGSVSISWGKLMTRSAGLCSFRRWGCSILLSEPLLKLRPRKDLVETLLHEMIHAYLFLTRGDKIRDGHGPEFRKHMYRINAEAGTNITIYHSFHEEVRSYQQHWWRCNGPCQMKGPYFGIVRRAISRPPGPSDFWWREHQLTCCGTYIKVKEPDKPLVPSNTVSKIVIPKSPTINRKRPNLLIKKTRLVQTKLTSIDAFGSKGQSSGSSEPKDNSIRQKSTSSNLVQSSLTQLINGLLNEGEDASGNLQSKDTVASGNTQKNPINKLPHIRNAAATSTSAKRSSSNDSGFFEVSPKHIKSHLHDINSTQSSRMILKTETKSHLNQSTSKNSTSKCPVCDKEMHTSKLEEHVQICLNEVFKDSDELTLDDFKPPQQKCPICDKQIEVSKLNEHLQNCVNEVFSDSDELTFDDFKSTQQELISCLVCNKNIIKSQLSVHLDECMGDDVFTGSNSNCTIDDEDLQNENEEEKYNCPICFGEYFITEMSKHVDQCLLNDSSVSESDSILSSFFEDSF